MIRATFLFFVFLSYLPPSLSQPNDDRRFFPYAVGNTWRWHNYATGDDFDSQITRDSVDSQGAHYIFYNDEVNPKYMIDTLDDVYQYVTETTRYLWFRLSAEQGDSFYTWNNSFKVDVEVGLNVISFGDSNIYAIFKEFSWYQTGTTYAIARQQLAENFGLIYAWSDIGPVEEYVTGCVIDGVRYGTLVSVHDGIENPLSFKLFQNFPNPFNPSTTFSFSIPKSSIVNLKVFDLLGQEVATIVNERLDAGSYSRQWDASGQPSGVFFYRLQAGDFTETRKLILLR